MPAHSAEALARFDAYLDAKSISPRTRRMYRYELICLWTDFLFDRGHGFAEMTEAEVDAYLSGLPRNGSKRGDAIRSLKSFYGWATGRLRPDNPTLHLKVPRPSLEPAPALSEAELRSLLRAAFRREPRRGWAILLCYATASRVGALVNVRASDIDLDAGLVRFRVTKGSRPYDVPLSRMSRVAAEHLIAADGQGTLLGVGSERFRQWLEMASREAGIRKVNPHLLRHTFLTRLAHAGNTDPDVVRRVANWADLSQYPRYVRPNERKMRRAMDEASSLRYEDGPEDAA